MSDLLIPAPRWKRLVATSIDAMLVPSLTVILVMWTNVAEDAEDYADNTWMLHVLLLAILSYLILNGFLLWRRGQTLGKFTMNIAIVDAASLNAANMTPNVAPFWRLIFVRAWFFALLFTFVIPYLAWIPLLDHLLVLRKDRRCLHDWVARTVVVQHSPSGEVA